MHSSEHEVAGAHCQLVHGGARSPLSVSLTRGGDEPAAAPVFGALAYGVPNRQTKAVATTLVASQDQSAMNAALHLAEVLATKFERPVYVNSSVGADQFMLYREVTAVVEARLQADAAPGARAESAPEQS